MHATGPFSDLHTGIPAIGSARWGAHLCHFYRTANDLREALVPYMRAGLESNEACLWITSAPLGAARARRALASVVPDLAERERAGQLEILDVDDWYTQAGAMDSSAVLESWIQREQLALERGFAGLRVSGNTFWLDRRDWDGFRQYEAAVHEAFRGRRIIALCSYSLERCSVDDALDVLHNHEVALVRRAGAWEVVRSATQLVDALADTHAPGAVEHIVHFYDDDRYPAAEIAEHLAAGAAAGNSVAVIATQQHLDAIGAELAAHGLHLGDMVAVEATALVASCERDGAPDMDAFRRAVEDLAIRLTATGRPATIYGEVVDILCSRGDAAAALELEHVWNDLIANRQVSLSCGYNLSSFSSAQSLDAYLGVCDAHATIYVASDKEDRPLVATALTHALARLRELESQRARLLQAQHEAGTRLARLQHVTTALAEARTFHDVHEIFENVVCSAVGAVQASVAPTDTAADTALAPLWLHDPREVESLARADLAGAHAAARVPLRLGDGVLGAILLGFATPQPFDASQRAFIGDLADQVALALDRVRLHEEVARQRDQAQEANHAKDEFLAMLGHELRNPLAAIRSATELLSFHGSGGANLPRIQEILARQTGHMAKLLDDLLDVSRIVQRKIELVKEPLDLYAILDDVMQDHRVRLHSRAIELRTELPDRPLLLEGDRVRLAQVFDNLLSNAVDFTADPGSVSVLAQRDGDHAVVTVRDTGVGIEAALLPRIFEPFLQVKQEVDRPRGGLGLGLAVVKGIVELHGGTVAAASDGPGLGTELSVRLPLSTTLRPSILPPSALATSVRILVVEDHRDTAMLLTEVLEAAGHTAVVAYDGEHALERARDFDPEVVLCDIGLPGGMSGYDVAQAFRRAPELSGVFMVAVTGYGQPEDVRRAVDSGFDAHIIKPFGLAKLESLLVRRAQRAAPALPLAVALTAGPGAR